jgi:PIN domain nuclease of toxin-antitoxin system
MIHLDTHALIWLYEGRTEKFPPSLLQWLGHVRPMVSPMVRVELALLHEIGRLTTTPPTILDAMRAHADLGIAESSFDRVAHIAATIRWTRDPFDRLIAAHAQADDVPLITCDETLLQHCPVARWE